MNTIIQKIALLVLLAFSSYEHCIGQTKYYKPTGIIDKTDLLVKNKAQWTSIGNKECIDGYTKIDNLIYGGEINCNVKPLEEANAQTFEVYPGSRYARDISHVYYPLMENCIDYADCGVCYYSKVVVEGASPKTFSYAGKDYAIDGNKVFYRGKILKDADGSTFSVIEGPEYFYVGKDKNHVYIHDEVFKDADPSTFHLDLKDNRNDFTASIYVIGDKNNTWLLSAPDQIEVIKTIK